MNIKKIKEDFYIRREANSERVLYKFFTFFIIWIFCVTFSLIISKIPGFSYYYFFYQDAIFFSPMIFFIIISWIIFIDKRIQNPYDNYYKFSYNLKNNKFILSIVVKIIFIPYMYSATFIGINQILNINISNVNETIKFLFLFGLCADLIIAFSGYLICSKFFNNENISIDNSWSGWFYCLICYAPLVVLAELFTKQVDSYIWIDWLNVDNIYYWIWALLIVSSWLVYWLCTLSFGLKFSNLSWRGIVDTGMYRYMKHPAYLSKNIYWWLHTVPFFGVVGWDIIRNILALSLVSLIYYMRAKTEERHLMQFDEYMQYSKWIDEHGIYAKFKKIIKNKY